MPSCPPRDLWTRGFKCVSPLLNCRQYNVRRNGSVQPDVRVILMSGYSRDHSPGPGGAGNACDLPAVDAVSQDRFPPPERKARRPALSGSATEDAPGGASAGLARAFFPYSPELLEQSFDPLRLVLGQRRSCAQLQARVDRALPSAKGSVGAAGWPQRSSQDGHGAMGDMFDLNRSGCAQAACRRLPLGVRTGTPTFHLDGNAGGSSFGEHNS